MQLGYSIVKRIEEIERLENSPHKPTETETLRISDEDSVPFPKYSIQLSMPKYRIQNTRTLGHQIEYANVNNKPNNFDDPESDAAQFAQHSILNEMLSENNLKSYFEAGRKQKDALVLTRDGFVISGNRRLCCWRELYEKNSSKYSHFEYIQVCVLEFPSDSPFVDKIEALQETDESIQSKFAWFPIVMRFEKILNSYNDQIDGYRRIINLYKNSKYITHSYESKRIEQINHWINTGKLAIELMGNEQVDLNFVNDNQYVFTEWNKGFSKIQTTKPKDESLYDEIAKQIVLVSPKSVKIGRKYSFIKKVVENFQKLKTRLIEEHELLTSPYPEIELINYIKKKKPEDIVENIKNHVEVINFNNNNKNKRRLTKDNISRAQEHMKNAWQHLEFDSDITGVIPRLEEIEDFLGRLLGKTRKMSD
jgi:hypothetical protein